MITQELLNYVKQQLALGKSESNIRDVLTNGGGWHRDEIDEAFKVASPPPIPTPPNPDPISPTINTNVDPVKVMSSQSFVSMQQKSRHFGKIFIIVIILGLIFLGWKMYGGNINLAIDTIKDKLLNK